MQPGAHVERGFEKVTQRRCARSGIRHAARCLQLLLNIRQPVAREQLSAHITTPLHLSICALQSDWCSFALDRASSGQLEQDDVHHIEKQRLVRACKQLQGHRNNTPGAMRSHSKLAQGRRKLAIMIDCQSLSPQVCPPFGTYTGTHMRPSPYASIYLI